VDSRWYLYTIMLNHLIKYIFSPFLKANHKLEACTWFRIYLDMWFYKLKVYFWTKLWKLSCLKVCLKNIMVWKHEKIHVFKSQLNGFFFFFFLKKKTYNFKDWTAIISNVNYIFKNYALKSPLFELYILKPLKQTNPNTLICYFSGNTDCMRTTITYSRAVSIIWHILF
jgi:hypothetical protein